MTLKGVRDFLLKVVLAGFVLAVWAFTAGLGIHSLVGLFMMGWRLVR